MACPSWWARAVLRHAVRLQPQCSSTALTPVCVCVPVCVCLQGAQYAGSLSLAADFGPASGGPVDWVSVGLAGGPVGLPAGLAGAPGAALGGGGAPAVPRVS